MTISNPQAFVILLLLVPFLKILLGGLTRLHVCLRVALVFLMVFVISDPKIDMSEDGIDVIVIADRSLSMGNDGQKSITELCSLLSNSKGSKDRIGMISFGATAVVEQAPDKLSELNLNGRAVNSDASNIDEALTLATNLVSPRRYTRVLLLSDGQYTGKSPLTNLSFDKNGVELWYRNCGKNYMDDIAAGTLYVPDEILPGTGFIINYTIYSTLPDEAQVTLVRNKLKIIDGKVNLKPGWNNFFARDIADSPGIFEYILTVDSKKDRITENNVSEAIVRVAAPPRVLHVTDNVSEGIINTSLTSANIPVDSRCPEYDIFNAARLTPYRVVIIENVPFSHIGLENAMNLSEAVKNGVVSLLVTGGLNSFGNGGYHKSPIDEIMPVTMRLREEKRKGLTALAVVVDRSGSMGVRVSSGETKMHLANTAAAECIRLLSPSDQVSYIAVDSSSHTIVPLSMADDTSKLIDAVMSVESMGGGIFVKTALLAAEKELEKSKVPTRHIILFSDASDSEEQEGCNEIASGFMAKKIGLSVIGLGDRSNVDAGFLIDLAKTAGGEIFFTNNAFDLPRIFSQEVVRVSRLGFVEEPCSSTIMPDMLTLGIPLSATAPPINGYNLSSLREGALLMLKTNDDYNAPLIATRRNGKAVTGAITAEVDAAERAFSSWEKTPEAVIAITKNLASGFNDADAKAFSSLSRGIATVRLELSETLASSVRDEKLQLTVLQPHGMGAKIIPMAWESPCTLHAVVELKSPGHYLPVIDLGKHGLVKAPVVSLSYSSEFMPVKDFNGKKVLEELALYSGGKELVSADHIFKVEGSARSRFYKSISIYIFFLCIVIFLFEIAEKRVAVGSLIKLLIFKNME